MCSSPYAQPWPASECSRPLSAGPQAGLQHIIRAVVRGAETRSARQPRSTSSCTAATMSRPRWRGCASTAPFVDGFATLLRSPIAALSASECVAPHGRIAGVCSPGAGHFPGVALPPPATACHRLRPQCAIKHPEFQMEGDARVFPRRASNAHGSCSKSALCFSRAEERYGV